MLLIYAIPINIYVKKKKLDNRLYKTLTLRERKQEREKPYDLVFLSAKRSSQEGHVHLTEVRRQRLKFGKANVAGIVGSQCER